MEAPTLYLSPYPPRLIGCTRTPRPYGHSTPPVRLAARVAVQSTPSDIVGVRPRELPRLPARACAWSTGSHGGAGGEARVMTGCSAVCGRYR